jgi:hypothetical protein
MSRTTHKPGAGKSEWFKDHELGPGMVVVPAGEFTMGSSPSEVATLKKEYGRGRTVVAPITDEDFACHWPAAYAASELLQLEFMRRTKQPPDPILFNERDFRVGTTEEEGRPSAAISLPPLKTWRRGVLAFALWISVALASNPPGSPNQTDEIAAGRSADSAAAAKGSAEFRIKKLYDGLPQVDRELLGLMLQKKQTSAAPDLDRFPIATQVTTNHQATLPSEVVPSNRTVPDFSKMTVDTTNLEALCAAYHGSLPGVGACPYPPSTGRVTHTVNGTTEKWRIDAPRVDNPRPPTKT